MRYENFKNNSENSNQKVHSLRWFYSGYKMTNCQWILPSLQISLHQFNTSDLRIEPIYKILTEWYNFKENSFILINDYYDNLNNYFIEFKRISMKLKMELIHTLFFYFSLGVFLPSPFFYGFFSFCPSSIYKLGLFQD